MSSGPSKQGTSGQGSSSTSSPSSQQHQQQDEEQQHQHQQQTNQQGGRDIAIHPSSKWQEPARDDELTLWDIHRKPRAIIPNTDRRIRCPLRMLNPEFRCVICLGYLKNTTMVMVCLHRFCGECIHKCVRVGIKECPSCRKPIPTRRSLRRDYNFDQIVQNLIRNASHKRPADSTSDGNDKNGSESMEANKMVHLQRAIHKKQNIVVRQKQQEQQQQQQSGTEKAKSKRAAATSTASSGTASTSLSSSSPHRPSTKVTISNLCRSPLLELELRRHPHEHRLDRLERGFLTLRGDAKVSLLKTFLNRKLESEEDRSAEDYEITSTLDDDSVVLDDHMALIDAQETLCPDRRCLMVLKYRLATTLTAPEAKGDAVRNEDPATWNEPDASMEKQESGVNDAVIL